MIVPKAGHATAAPTAIDRMARVARRVAEEFTQAIWSSRVRGGTSQVARDTGHLGNKHRAAEALAYHDRKWLWP